jgi:hypothetical protein
VGPRVGLDDVEKRKFLTLPGLEMRPRPRPARSQSLYRLPALKTVRIILKIKATYFALLCVTLLTAKYFILPIPDFYYVIMCPFSSRKYL